MKKNKTKISQKIIFKLRLAFLALLIISLPAPAFCRTFDPNNIITDEELSDKNSLSISAIQNFLEQKNSVLKNYSQTIDGKKMLASEMIWQVGQKHNISPKFILTTLEKEKSLLSKTSATQSTLDWACGFGCYGGTCREKYRGFYNQIEAAAETQEAYRLKASQFNYRVGLTSKTFDNFLVTPQNQATANFYIYTPYVGYSPELGVTDQNGGNRLFWRIWHRYFSNQKFLDGQVVTDGLNYWLIKNNLKYQFASKEIFLGDYKLSDAILTTQDNLKYYPDGTKIYYSSKTLVKSSLSGQIFLIENGQKRPLINESALAVISDFSFAATGEIRSATEDQLSVFTLGQIIAENSIYPQGKLYKDTNGTIWLIKDGLRHEVNSLVWQNNFDSAPTELVQASSLDIYPVSSPIKFEDGTFLNVDGAYYLISNGERMRIYNLGVFDRVFGVDKKNSAIRVSAALLNIHDAGEIIDYMDDTIQDSTSSQQDTSSGASATTVAAGTYQGQFISTEPQGITMATGNSQSVTIAFKNTGSATWAKGAIWLQVNDQGQTTSSFTAPAKVEMNEGAVSFGQVATFTFNLTAPIDKNGMVTEDFAIYYNQTSPTQITSVTKFVLISGQVQKTTATQSAKLNAQLISENIPAKIKYASKPVSVKMILKNESDITWLSKKSALEAFGQTSGKPSVFYDKYDWIRNMVPAVPINKSQIKPGEQAEFQFTLDVTGIKRGTYTLRLRLNLLDKNKIFTINGASELVKTITVE